MPPNIVFIITDQQRFDTIAALGADHMETPNLDRMAREGAAFTNMYVTSPSCAPSRASLFSGTYPHTNGVFRNDEPWTWTWVPLLNQAGYRCVNVGKMHTSPFEVPFGFHERHVVENKDRAHPALPFYLDTWDKILWATGLEKPSRVTYRRRADYRDRMGAFVWEAPAHLHPDNFVGELAVHWLRSWTGEGPFFLQVGFPGPHPPYDPTQDWLDRYEGKSLPEAIRGDDPDSEPAPLRALRRHHQRQDHDAVVHLADPTPEQLRRQRMHYYANVSMIDAKVGEILAALEARGVLGETMVIFTSDHGDALNDHGHIQKWTMYEASVKVPALVWHPGVVAPQRIDGLAQLFDLGPTILETAGVEPPDWMAARSLLPALTGKNPAMREAVFAEHADDLILDATEFVQMVREDRWKLVTFLGSGEGQLFDLDADPEERANLWDDPEHAAVRDRLTRALADWRIRSAKRSQGFVRAVAGA